MRGQKRCASRSRTTTERPRTRAVRKNGTEAGSRSRRIAGELQPHHGLPSEKAQYKHGPTERLNRRGGEEIRGVVGPDPPRPRLELAQGLATAGRKPRVSPRRAGLRSLRSATRQRWALRFQLPPRKTRRPVASLPMGGVFLRAILGTADESLRG